MDTFDDLKRMAKALEESNPEGERWLRLKAAPCPDCQMYVCLSPLAWLNHAMWCPSAIVLT